MKRTLHPIGLVLAGLAFAAAAMDAARAINLLNNPGFEQPQVTTPGNNFPVTLPGWTLQTTTAPCENGHNVVRGGDRYDGGPDNAVEGLQYYDICGAAGYLSQSFNLTVSSDVSFGASFSRRGADGGGGNVEIYDAANTTRMMASPAVTVASVESQELWVQSSALIPNLAAGTYVVRVNIEDAANADAVFVTPVRSRVVGNGTAASVTEADLDAALAQDTATITFKSGGEPVNLQITTTKNITRNVTINGGNKVTLTAGGSRRLFSVAPGVALELRDLTLDNGFSGRFSSGGAILNQGNLVLNNVRITRSVSSEDGGAIQNSGVLTGNGARFDYNRATGNGGAIDNTGRLILANCTANNNSAGFRGGAFYNYLGSIETAGCAVKWNTAGVDGGGIAADGGVLRSTNDRVRGNRAGGGGGGLSLNAAATVRGTELTLNTAAGFGGSVDVVDGTATLEDLRIYNCAGDLGGGLATHAGTTTVTRALIQYNRNTTTANHINYGGGGVYMDAGALTIIQSRISNNRATYAGGGVMVNDLQKVVLKNCIVSDNTASFGQLGTQQGTLEIEDCTVGPGRSPGIWSDGGTLTMSRCTVFGHTGPGEGGGITLRRGAAATITNSTISGNSANWGGGIFLEAGGNIAELTNVTVAGNSSGSGGGNLYIGNAVSLTLKNTIIANPGFGGNCAGKEVTSSRYSICSDNLCGLAGPGDRNGTDPLLGPLQNNGGPTMTHVPQAGSPAIDGVLGTQAPAQDQRGRARPAGLGYDIGAVEVNAGGSYALNPPPPVTFDGNDTGDDDGDGLRDVEEFIAGTDPNSPSDVFRLSISPSNPYQVTFPTRTGTFYRHYVSFDQASQGLSEWSNAGPPTITGNDGIQSFTITPAAGVSRRFYRVRAMATDGPWP